MPFEKGNKLGGRKSLEEEMKGCKEAIKRNALEELAKEKVFNHIKMTKSKDRQGIKDIALPVYLKSQREKVDVTTDGEKITGFNFIKNDTNNKTNTETGGSLE